VGGKSDKEAADSNKGRTGASSQEVKERKENPRWPTHKNPILIFQNRIFFYRKVILI
jgi:hypothetical protein